MTTLLLRLQGPMQSWGVESKFDVRDTGREPSKSGVIGLLCAALGRPRSAPIDDLTALQMGVRVDQEGVLKRDYHTAGQDGLYLAKGSVQQGRTVVSTRYYLADACFLVGLEGQPDLLDTLYVALRDPVWSLYLGRKAFVPGAPVWLPDGLRQSESLHAALKQYPWLKAQSSALPERLRIVMDDPQGIITRQDLPLSFAERRFMLRRVTADYVPFPGVREESS